MDGSTLTLGKLFQFDLLVMYNISHLCSLVLVIIRIYYYVDIWNKVQYVKLCSVKTVLCYDQLLCRLEFKRLVCFWRTVESDESESERRQLMKRESAR